MWRHRRKKKATPPAVETPDLFALAEQAFIAENLAATRAAAEALDGAVLREASLDKARGSLWLKTDTAVVQMSTRDVADATEILSMLTLEQVKLLGREREGRLVVLARSATWSYRVSGLVASSQDVAS